MNTKPWLTRLPILVLLAVCSLVMLPSAVRAQGGPPMLTDDPATPGDGMWEINFLTTVNRNRQGWLFETPIVDVNYGWGHHIQLKVEAPWVVTKENGETKSGLGNSMVGVKWRFIDEERRGFDVSIYPQLEFNNPTRSLERGIVDSGARLFLPLEVARKVGPFEVAGEFGYRFVQGEENEMEYGILFSHQVSERFELMGELHGAALTTGNESELFVNAGSRIKLGRNALLLLSAGRTIHNPHGQGPQNIAAVGLQINFRKKLPGLRGN